MSRPAPAVPLLASDLDGTLIPTGPEEEEALDALARFRELVSATGLTLAYVTGRRLELAEDGIERFGLPAPTALACDVGARVYWREDARFVRDEGYDRLLADSGAAEGEEVRRALSGVAGLRLQSEENQGRFKVSYRLERPAGAELVTELARRLEPVGRHRIVVSVDPLDGAGLVDVLPEAAGKDRAVRHVAERLGVDHARVVFAGDSGNDVDALLSGSRAIVVGNAREELKRELKDRARRRGLAGRVFFARSAYAAGVLEGLDYFGRSAGEKSAPE